MSVNPFASGQQAGGFGGASNPFGGTQATAAPAAGTAFGQPAATANPFGGTQATAAPAAGNPFGQPAATANPFGGGAPATGAYGAVPPQLPMDAPLLDAKVFLDLEYGSDKLDQYDRNRFRKLEADIEEQSQEQRALPKESDVKDLLNRTDGAIGRVCAALHEAHADVAVLKQNVDGIRDALTDDDADASHIMSSLDNRAVTMMTQELPTRPMRRFVHGLENRAALLERTVADVEASIQFESDPVSAAALVAHAGSEGAGLLKDGWSDPLGSHVAAGGQVPSSSSSALVIADTANRAGVALAPARGRRGMASHVAVAQGGGASRTSAVGALPGSGLSYASSVRRDADVLSATLQAHQQAIVRVAGGTVGRLVERLDDLKAQFNVLHKRSLRARMRRGETAGMDSRLLAQLESDPFAVYDQAAAREREMEEDEKRRLVYGEMSGVVGALPGGYQQPMGQPVYGSSGFAATAPAATSNPFGGAPAATSNPFGGAPAATANPFGGAPAPAPAAAANPFGGAPAATSNPFGGAPAATANPFGGAPAAPQQQGAVTNPFAA